MNKINIATRITEVLELNSYDKRAFLEDTEWDSWLENSCELSSLVHTHLLLSRNEEQLKERIQQDIIKLETIAKLLTVKHEEAI